MKYLQVDIDDMRNLEDALGRLLEFHELLDEVKSLESETLVDSPLTALVRKAYIIVREAMDDNEVTI